MAFTLIPTNSGYPTTGYSLPNMVSFCVEDDGAGGEILINGQGINDPTVADAVDLKTMFTGVSKNFNSIPLLRAFRIIPSTLLQDGLDQNIKNLEISFYQVGQAATGSTGLLFIPIVGAVGGPDNVPYLVINAPGADSATQWRIELKLRHSITD